MSTNDTITFRKREFKGSRLRCLQLTNAHQPDVARFLTELVASQSAGDTIPAVVTSNDHWTPQGFLKPDEAELGKSLGLLNITQREDLVGWWLAKRGRANTPNWDLISTATFGDRQGLILVEAKAHEGEFSDDRCGATNQANYQRIQGALKEANDEWNQLLPGFSLSATHHYQLSNRFAFAWKLASMGVPVVLVYLGFLNAEEMTERDLLRSDTQWRDCVKRKAKGVIPADTWERTFDVQGTSLTVLIRTATVRVESIVSVVTPTA